MTSCMLRSVAIALSLMLPAFPASAERPSEAQLNTIVTRAMAEQRVPGVAVAVMEQGKIVFKKGYGLANLELQVPVTPASVFQSGSVGKMFTATAVMLLVKDGELRLDDSVARFFPEAPESWNAMTVRHLLSHTSGISEDLYSNIDFHRDYSDAELVQRIHAWPLDFPPGTDFRYSNPGYILLGLLIEEVTGSFYGDFLQDRVFEPVGMTTARVNDIKAIVPNRAAGYELAQDGTLSRDSWVSPSLSVTADGSLLLTVLDLARWDAALYTEDLLPMTDLRLMWQGGPLRDGSFHPADYGFGWSTNSVRGHRVVAHSGGWQGFRTYLARYVDDGLSIAVLANLNAADPGGIAKSVAAAFIPELAAYEPLPDPDPALTSRLRQIVREYLNDDIDRAAFTAAALERWDEKQHRRNARSVAGIDDETEFELVDHRRYAGLDSRTFRVTHEQHAPYLVRVDLTPDRKIEDLSFRSNY